MNLDGKRFLVIGGAGFIGSHVVERLLREQVALVRIFDNFSRGSAENLAESLRDPRAEIFPLGGELLHRDLLREAMEGIDGVFHLAALWLQHCHEFPRSAFEVNIGGTFNVLEACLEAGIERLVYSSSASVYGDAVEEPMTESHPYANTNFYGATKICGEMMCRALHHRHRGGEHPLDYVGLRYMNVYGPRQDYRGAYVSVIMKILDRLDRGLPPIVFGEGTQAYDFVYVDDSAEANLRAMQADTTDTFYNVGTGTKTTIRELTEMLIELTGIDIGIEYEPAGVSFVTNRVGCTERRRAELGFTAGTELTDGLRRLIEWRQAHRDEVEARRLAAEPSLPA